MSWQRSLNGSVALFAALASIGLSQMGDNEFACIVALVAGANLFAFLYDPAGRLAS